ncbi:MAG: hypothetical protein ACW981_06720 [Candidatus Hodarchaeales archaeon]
MFSKLNSFDKHVLLQSSFIGVILILLGMGVILPSETTIISINPNENLMINPKSTSVFQIEQSNTLSDETKTFFRVSDSFKTKIIDNLDIQNKNEEILSNNQFINNELVIDDGVDRSFPFEMSSGTKYRISFEVVTGGAVDLIFTDSEGFQNYNAFDSFTYYPDFSSFGTKQFSREFDGWDDNRYYFIVENSDHTSIGVQSIASVTINIQLETVSLLDQYLPAVYLLIILIPVFIIFYFVFKRYMKKREITMRKKSYDMFKGDASQSIKPMSKQDLDRFWLCPQDKVRLQIHVERSAHSPNFNISRKNLKQGFQNAAALRKIPSKAISQSEEIASYIFENSSLDEIEFVSVKCPNCGQRYSAPDTSRMEAE